MCIALLLIAMLAGLVIGSVYTILFEGGLLSFLIVYWAGGTISFLAMSLALFLRGDRASDNTGILNSPEGNWALNAHSLDDEDQVLPRESFGSQVIASATPHLEWTGANEVARRLG